MLFNSLYPASSGPTQSKVTGFRIWPSLQGRRAPPSNDTGRRAPLANRLERVRFLRSPTLRRLLGLLGLLGLFSPLQLLSRTRRMCLRASSTSWQKRRNRCAWCGRNALMAASCNGFCRLVTCVVCRLVTCVCRLVTCVCRLVPPVFYGMGATNVLHTNLCDHRARARSVWGEASPRVLIVRTQPQTNTRA